MICAWNAFLRILPVWMRQEVDRLGRDTMLELRLRCDAPPELILADGNRWLSKKVTAEDLQTCINAASMYSPWAAETASQGYITAPGGHRIGLCGEAVLRDGAVTGMRRTESLCIRIARDYPEVCAGFPSDGSVLILGAPGWGKTTLLRSGARLLAEKETVAVVDERGELYPPGFARGRRMDVLTGCPKTEGIERLLRTMGPQYVAVDEITARQDCEALLHAVGCGVRLLASAHASSMEDFLSRSVYHPLVERNVFDHILLLNRRRTWREERRRA